MITNSYKTSRSAKKRVVIRASVNSCEESLYDLPFTICHSALVVKKPRTIHEITRSGTKRSLSSILRVLSGVVGPSLNRANLFQQPAVVYFAKRNGTMSQALPLRHPGFDALSIDEQIVMFNLCGIISQLGPKTFRGADWHRGYWPND